MNLSLPTKLKNIKINATLILWIVLFVVLVLDTLALKRSYALLGTARTQDLGLQPSRSVRVNFESYDAVVERITKAATFTPGPVTVPNPFKTPPKKSQ